MSAGQRRVLRRILGLIDRYDLYGSAAYPKHHDSTDVPELYKLAAQTRGVFVNPALTEPFGLTLLEAAATGVPLVATNDGGPQDIIGTCNNGLLVDALDSDAIGKAIRDALERLGALEPLVRIRDRRGARELLLGQSRSSLRQRGQARSSRVPDPSPSIGLTASSLGSTGYSSPTSTTRSRAMTKPWPLCCNGSSRPTRRSALASRRGAT